MKTIFTIFLITISLNAFTKRINKERYYQEHFAEYMNGKIEVVLPDRTRVDIVTDIYAIEVDFGNKWAESIGQSLYYALSLRLKPAVLLILENPETEGRYLKRLMKVADSLNIKVWVINSQLDIIEAV